MLNRSEYLVNSLKTLNFAVDFMGLNFAVDFMGSR